MHFVKRKPHFQKQLVKKGKDMTDARHIAYSALFEAEKLSRTLKPVPGRVAINPRDRINMNRARAALGKDAQ